MNENVTVCITPKGDKPVLHFSQFDNENVFTVTVLADDGESAAVLTGLDIEFRLRKTDSHVVTIAPESVSDNVITFKTTEQMCACCGQNIASVTLMKDDMVISTLDILVEIQRDILSGGLQSESDIRNLTSQIEQIVPEVIGDDYYNKQEVDEKIAEIPTFDPTNYYDKSEVDDLLEDKADADDVYTKSEVYNKSEVDDLLSAKMNNIGYKGIVDDVAIISFNTDSDAPMAIIKGNITPVQSGSGTPSPQNVRPISGFSGANIVRCGENICGGEFLADIIVNKVPNATKDTVNKTVSYSAANINNKVIFDKFKPNTQYTFICKMSSGVPNLGIFYTNGTVDIISEGVNVSRSDRSVAYLGGAWATGSSKLLYDDFGIFEGVKTQSDFEPYNGQTATVNFGQTVYGGVADVTNGKVTITHGFVDLGSLTWVLITMGDNRKGFRASLPLMKTVSSSATAFNAICSNYATLSGNAVYSGSIGISAWGTNATDIGIYDSTKESMSVSDFKTAMSGVQLVYELATPIEITTTPVTVSSIAGVNNIFIDTGNLTQIDYFEDVDDNLNKLLKAYQIL